jgi:hypothetical protein
MILNLVPKLAGFGKYSCSEFNAWHCNLTSQIQWLSILFYMTISLFLITAAVLVAAVVTVIVYNVNVANAQSSNMTKTKTMTGPNMTKTTNMTASGGNMTKTTTASADNWSAYSECLRSSCDLF